MTARASIRPAVAGDLDRLLELGGARRRQYALYQPVFWRPATDAVEQQRRFLAKLISDDAVITVVADTGGTLVGFAVGTFVAAPPVYDPGGSACVVDDFAVAAPQQWLTVGVDLLRAIRHTARERGAAQVVVVCGHLDGPKRTTLEQRAEHRLRVVGRSAAAPDADVISACRPPYGTNHGHCRKPSVARR